MGKVPILWHDGHVSHFLMMVVCWLAKAFWRVRKGFDTISDLIYGTLIHFVIVNILLEG